MAGPGVAIAYAIAGFLSLLLCLTTAQLGTALPTNGGTFVLVSSLLSVRFGFMTIWLILVAAAIGVAFLGFGFADYLCFFIPNLNRQFVAYGTIITFGLVNLLGSRTAVNIQGIMVIWFLVALAIFIFTGIGQINRELLFPVMPQGFSTVLHAATVAYFSFSGFTLLLEIGGVIKNPRRTIPLALTIGFLVVLFCYCVTSIVLVGLVPWTDLADQAAPVAYAARIILPAWVVTFIASSVLAAAATSINGIILAYSRDLMVLAQNRILPSCMAKVSSRGEPANAIVVFSTGAVIAAMFNANLADYASFIVLAVMVQQIMLAVCLVRLPRVLPSQYAASAFKLSEPMLFYLAVLLSATSVFFIYILVKNSEKVVYFFLSILVFGTIYFLIRSKFLKKRGIDLCANLKSIVRGGPVSLDSQTRSISGSKPVV